MSRYVILCVVGGAFLAALAAAASGPLGLVGPLWARCWLGAALAVPAVGLAALALTLQGAAARAAYDAMEKDFGRLQRDYLTLKSAVEGSRQQVVRASSLMDGLAAVASMTAKPFELPKLLGSLLELVAGQVGARRASLWLVDQETGALKFQVGLGWTDEQRAGTILKPFRSVEELRAGSGLPSVRFAPLVTGGEVLGALNVEDLEPGRLPGQAEEAEDGRVLALLASVAAMGVRNARAASGTPDPALLDGLTRLSTYQCFQDTLDAELRRADRYGDFLSLILVDLDRFTAFNEDHGSKAGDLVLRGAAGILRASVREMDLVARYGGGQFVAVLPQTNKAGAIALAERLRVAVERRAFETDAGAARVTLSLGVATFPADARDKAQLVARADAALSEAKQLGRNRVRFASSPGDGLPPSAPSPA